MKLKVTGLKREMSTTGTGASFTPGMGAQYASPKAFKKKTDEIGEPFEIPNPSVPNRKSKFIDYKQLFEDAIEEIEIGDTKTDKGITYTVSDIDPETGQISWDIDYVPAFDSVYKEFDDLRKVIAKLDQKTDDAVVDDIAAKIKAEFNRYRTHIRKNYPEAYKKFTINEELRVSKGVLEDVINMLGKDTFADMIIALSDENVQDEIVSAFNREYPKVMDMRTNLNEARYTQFKQETKLRTPTEQIHRAVREIRRKIDEIVKVVAHTERMKAELKQSNEGMSYLKRTRNAINTISEKLQELNNKIKGLTE